MVFKVYLEILFLGLGRWNRVLVLNLYSSGPCLD